MNFTKLSLRLLRPFQFRFLPPHFTAPIFPMKSLSRRLITPAHSRPEFAKGPSERSANMTSYSNADMGSKHLDPYKEKNMDEPSLQDKINDLSNFISACKFGMMTTRAADTGMLMSRCMALAAKENGGIDLLFHTKTESGKTNDLTSDSHINVSFLNSSGEWASISGTASIETDRNFVHKHYSQDLKVWLGDLGDGKHDGGPDDPRIGVIRVRTNTATYAIVRNNFAARVADVAQGMMTGNTPSVKKLREISHEEVEAWRASQRMV